MDLVLPCGLDALHIRGIGQVLIYKSDLGFVCSHRINAVFSCVVSGMLLW